MKKHLIIAFFLLASVHCASAQTPQLLDSLNRLLATSKADTNRVLLLVELGRAYIYSNSDTAIHHVQKALALAEKLKYTRGESYALSLIAFSQIEKRNYVAALQYAQKSLQVASQGNHLFEKAFAYLRLATLSGITEDVEAALAFFKEAENIFLRLENEERLATVYNNIGSTYGNEVVFIKDRRVHDSLCFLSLTYYTKAEALRRKNKQELGLATVLSNIAENRLRLGQDSLASVLLPELEALANRFNNAREKFSAKLSRTMILLHKGQLAEAEKLALELLAEEKAIWGKPTNRDLYKLLNELYAQKKDYEKAYQYRIIYQELRENELYKPEAKKAMMEIRKNLEEEKRLAEAAEAEKEKQIQQLYWLLAGGGFVVILLVLGMVYRNNLRQKQNNQVLQEKNEEISQQAEELQQANEEVLAQRDNLQKSYESVELLSAIGKKITATLQFKSIFGQLYESINQLMDATIFGVGIYQESKQLIHYELAIERGVAYLPYTRSMQDKSQLPVQCILEKKEIVINDLSEKANTLLTGSGTLEDGTQAEEPNSVIYIPLLNNQENVLGIITVQSFQKNAYSDYHLNILRNLAIYTAIALENAESFNEIQLKNAEINTQREEILTTLENLQTAQEQLIQAEKLAVMGKLVASVAHEINTPLGAIRASAGNIVTDLNEALQELPKLFQILSPEQQENFFALINKALEQKHLLSSREERAARKVLEAELESNGVENADDLAYELASMGFYANASPFLPILKDENARFITKIAFHLVNQQRSTDNINMAVDKASKVVFALKTYARHDQSGEKTKANITNGIETVLTLYHNQLKQNTEVIKHYQEIPEILCFPDELNQVWTNLIHNAMHAMQSSKGKLEITTQQIENQIEVLIKDNGKGIPDDIKPKIFDAFFTTKPEGEGSGLGLDIVKKIIDKHQGSIGFDSEVGKGTTFWVRLPIL